MTAIAAGADPTIGVLDSRFGAKAASAALDMESARRILDAKGASRELPFHQAA